MRAQTIALRTIVADMDGWKWDRSHGGYAFRTIDGPTKTSWPLMVFVRWDSDEDYNAYSVDYKDEYGLNEHVGLFSDPREAMEAAQVKYLKECEA
jgi:hypothetical protein